MNNQKILDKDLAIQRAGGNIDLARELFVMLVEGMPGNRDEIQQLYEEGNFTSLKEKVHKLHGATAYCGVPALKMASESFETHLKQGEQDKYAQGMSQLLQAMDLLMQEAKNGF